MIPYEYEYYGLMKTQAANKLPKGEFLILPFEEDDDDLREYVRVYKKKMSFGRGECFTSFTR